MSEQMYELKEMKWLLRENGWKLYKRKDGGNLVAQDPWDKSRYLDIEQAYEMQFFRTLDAWKPGYVPQERVR